MRVISWAHGAYMQQAAPSCALQQMIGAGLHSKADNSLSDAKRMDEAVGASPTRDEDVVLGRRRDAPHGGESTSARGQVLSATLMDFWYRKRRRR